MRRIRGQSAIEYMVTYGWALLIIAIAFAMLLAFVTLPSRATPNECSFTSTVTCVDFILGSSSGRTTTMTINMTNSQQYPLLDPELVVEVNGKNSSLTTCTPTYVQPQKEIYCSVTLPINTSQGTLLSGNLYLNITNCALSSNYISSGLQTDCTGAAEQTIIGHYVGHTEVPFTVASGTIYVSTAYGGFPYTPGNVLAITFQSPNTISITNTIDAGAYFDQLIASPDGKYIYGISASTWQTLYTMSTQQGIVTNTLTLPGSTVVGDTLTIDPTGSYLYVCGQNGDIWKISASTHAIVSTITALSGVVLYSCTVSPTGSSLYVAGTPSGSSPPTSFYTISLSSGTITNTISGLAGACNYVIVAVVPDGSDAYTGCSNGMEIDLSTDTVVATGVSISGYLPTGTVFSSDSKYMYTAGGGNDYTKMFVSNNIIAQTVSGFSAVYGTAMIGVGSYIALGDQGTDQVYVYNTATGTKAANILMPNGGIPEAVVET